MTGKKLSAAGNGSTCYNSKPLYAAHVRGHSQQLPFYAEAEEEEEAESEREEEDIFALEGETEHLHLSTPGQPQEQPNQERIQGRGGWEGAASGAPSETFA